MAVPDRGLVDRAGNVAKGKTAGGNGSWCISVCVWCLVAIDIESGSGAVAGHDHKIPLVRGWKIVTGVEPSDSSKETFEC